MISQCTWLPEGQPERGRPRPRERPSEQFHERLPEDQRSEGWIKQNSEDFLKKKQNVTNNAYTGRTEIIIKKVLLFLISRLMNDRDICFR